MREVEIIDIHQNIYHYYNIEYFWNKDGKFELTDQDNTAHYFNPDNIIKYSIKETEHQDKKDYVLYNDMDDMDPVEDENFHEFVNEYFKSGGKK